MKQNSPYTRRLRRSRTSAFVALAAMLFQILFAMEHASAMAAAVARGGADGTPMGFLEICTARGFLRIPAPAGAGLDEQPAPRSSGGESCAVCGSAAVSGASDTTAVARVLPPPNFNKVSSLPSIEIDTLPAGFKRSGTTRGPPSC